MSYLPTNSTNIPLLANQEFVGDSVIIDTKFISVSCSFNSNVTGGVLEFFFSIDGFSFTNYGDIFDFTDKPGSSHSIEVSIKGKYFKIRYINGSQNQSFFNLFCKLNEQVAEAILNATYDSVEVYAGGSGLNIRHLDSTVDSITIPTLNKVLYNDSGISTLLVTVQSAPPIVIPPITISSVSITDTNGNDILSNSSGYLQTQIMNSTLQVNTISGYATSAHQVTAQASLTSLVNGTRIQASNGNLITVDASNNLNTVIKNDVSITGHVVVDNVVSVTGDFYPLIQSITGHIIVDNVVSVTGDFYPSLQSITGHVVVDNVVSVTGDFYPLIQSITGHINVDNVVSVTGDFYPSLQSITGHVIVDNVVSVTGDFYPLIQSVTGHVVVDNIVSVTGSFYPSVQSITGHVNVDNVVSVTGDFYPLIQSITGHIVVDNVVSVTGDFYPSLQSITGHVIVDNVVSVTGSFYQETQPISGFVKMMAKSGIGSYSEVMMGQFGNPYSTLVTTDGYVLQTVNNDQDLPILQTHISNQIGITGTVDTGLTSIFINNSSLNVSTGLTSIFINNSSLNVSTGLTMLKVEPTTNYNSNNTFKNSMYDSGGTAITSSTPITGKNSLDTSSILYCKSGASSIAPVTSTLNGIRQELDVNMEKTDVHLYAKKPVSGNSMEILTTDNHNHLSVRLTNDDESKYNTFDTDGGLNCHITNTASIPVSTSLNGLTSSISIGDGVHNAPISLISSNPLYDETYGLSTKSVMCGVLYSGAVPGAIAPVGLTADTSMKVNVSNTVTVSGNVGITGTVNTTISSANIKDSSGNAITSLTTPSNCVGAIKTALYGTVTNNVIGDTAASPHGTTKTGLNNFIVNSYTLPVICGGYDGTNTQGFKTTSEGSQYVAFDMANNMVGITASANTIKIDTSNNTIKIDNANNTVQFSQTSNQNNIKITDAGGDIATVSTPYLPSGVSTIRGLDTQACVNALDIYNNTYDNVTLTPAASGPNAGYKALDTYVRNPSTTNEYGTVGLNTYVIAPKTRTFTMAGNAINVANVMWAGLGSTIDVASISWGTDLSAKIFYFYHTTSPITPLSCILNYIKKSDGKEATYTINTTVNAPTQNTYYNLFNAPFNLTDIACINSFNTVGSTVSATSYRILTSNSDLTKSVASIHNTDLQYCGFFMCPAGARAFVSYLSVVVTASGEYLKFIKWTKEGYRRVINTIYVFINLNNVFTSSSDNGASSLSGWIYPGETFAINATGTATNRQGSWNITVIYD